MSDESTIRLIRVYNQMASPTLFLSGFFRSPPINFHNTENVEIDVIRSEEDIAIVIQDISVGYRENATDIYTNKRFKPPIFKEKVSINAFDLLKRMPGQNPFKNPDFRGNVIARMMLSMPKIEDKIRRSIELQASQVLQTGIVTLFDENGKALYTLDYKPKSSHFPTAGNAWGGGSATIAADIDSLGEVVRDDGKADPDQLLLGKDAFEAFITDPDILARYDNRRIDLGTISPFKMNGQGGKFRGIVEIANYRYDIWTYGGRFKDPQTGLSTQYIDPASAIVRASGARLDLTFGAIPNIGKLVNAQGQAGTLLPEFPGRFSNNTGGMDLFTNVWLTPDGEQLFGGVGARPLAIPTAIDTFGTLDTLAA